MNTMSRRDALKLGTNVAVSAAITPLLSAKSAEANSIEAGPTSTTGPSLANAPDSSTDICFMGGVDMAGWILEKKLLGLGVSAGLFQQIWRVNSKVNVVCTLSEA